MHSIKKYWADSKSACAQNHPDFNVYETKLTETKFEIGIEVKNIVEPIYPEALSKRESEIRQANNGTLSWHFGSKEDIANFYGSEEYADMFIKYRNDYELFGDSINLWFPWQEPRQQCSVVTESGEKFRLKPTMSTSISGISKVPSNFPFLKCELEAIPSILSSAVYVNLFVIHIIIISIKIIFPIRCSEDME